MATNNIVFLFDVDNTLLDNDRVTADLQWHLEQQVGQKRQQRYWDFFEQLRSELGYADYLGALQRYRIEYPRDPGLLGIGSGAMKVLAMDQIMKIPFKVSTTTSNFMIGVTAAASAGVYLKRGFIEPGLAMPVMLGVLAGSMLGAKILVRTRTKVLRVIFALVIVAMGIEMIFNALTGRL